MNSQCVNKKKYKILFDVPFSLIHLTAAVISFHRFLSRPFVYALNFELHLMNIVQVYNWNRALMTMTMATWCCCQFSAHWGSFTLTDALLWRWMRRIGMMAMTVTIPKKLNKWCKLKFCLTLFIYFYFMQGYVRIIS